MTDRTCLIVLGLIVLLSAGAAVAQEPDKSKDEEGDAAGMEEVVVVTASRTEQRLTEVPAAMTVLDSETLAQTPADDYGDYLRNVPGLNVAQMSARDIQITGRAATKSLATSQLVLLDNRSLYLDFFGFVMWDFAPLDPTEIKQIEIVRGPGSAVWGANAMSGVINMITKAPKEMEGTTLTLGGGELGTAFANVTHAGVRGKVGYKVTAAYYEQDPYDRPTGAIPGTEGPSNPGGTQYPPFQNQGTEQPKINARVDYEPSDDTTWSFSGGYAETDGIIHSGIGPFDIESGTSLSYGKVDFAHENWRVTFSVNVLDGDADNLLSVDPMGQPIGFKFETDTYNLDFSHTRLAGERHVLTYGATVRTNKFDLSIAPQSDDRDEVGVFLQDEILFGEKVRWLIGARWDDLDPIDTVVSPRTSLLFRPTKKHSLRFSYNRAFRAPSVVQNYLAIDFIPTTVDLTPLGGPAAFPVIANAGGNPDLDEERLDAFEIGWVGTVGDRTTLTVSVYRNETKDSIDFFTAAAYTSANPPPFWPINPAFLDAPPLAGALPSNFSYRNIGKIVDKGVEVSADFDVNAWWSLFGNYSWQDESDVEGIPQEMLPNGTTRDAVSTAPEHRANVGAAFQGVRFFANGNVNYVDEAFWTDVLDSRFWGPTDSYTMVNVGAGVHISDNVTLSVNAQNVFDSDVMQHVFGDEITRKVSGTLRLRFD